jgi:acetyl-CoA acetyltransferase
VSNCAAAVGGAPERLDGLFRTKFSSARWSRPETVRVGIPLTAPAMTLINVCLASMTSATRSANMVRADEINSTLVGGFDS